jgi:hypothetical protein
VILGSADAPDGINHMVTWDAVSGAITHDYGPRLAGYAINDRGDIVGIGYRATSTNQGEPLLLVPEKGGGRPKD